MSPSRRALVAALALVACQGAPPPVPPEADPAALALCPLGSHPQPVTMIPDRATAGASLTGASAMRIEVELQAGVTIPARGLADGMLEIEVPSNRYRPAAKQIPDLDRPQFLNPAAPGFWKAVFFDEGRCTRRAALDLELLYDDVVTTATNRDVISVVREVGTLLDTDDVMDEGDVIVFVYSGAVPARSTNWTANADLDFYPNVRFHDGTTFTEVSRASMSPMVIEPGPARFVHLVAPLDVAEGDSPTVQVIATDEWGNPADLSPFAGWSVGTMTTPGGASTSYCTPVEDGSMTVGAVPDVAWRASCSGPAVTGTAQVKFVPHQPGVPLPDDVEVVSHWTRVHAEATFDRRAVGDTHVHTGLSLDSVGPETFVGTTEGVGDHHRQTADHLAALTYLDTVSGYDFGTIANHAVEYDGWTLAPSVAGLADWDAAGDACRQDPVVTLDPLLGDWWSEVQDASRTYQTGLGTDFAVFPGFEWHSEHQPLSADPAEDGSRLHRVVLYRDFDAADALPMLPGTTADLPPQCLVQWVKTVLGPGGEAEGNDAILIPHMMQSQQNWDGGLTYGDTYASIASAADVAAYHVVGEVFSARVPGTDLRRFEGDDSGDVRYHTYQSAWLECGAQIGLVGSSDNHSQMPGADDDLFSNGVDAPFVRGHEHNEPTGTAFVLTDDGTRAGIFEAMRARRTYATTGLRAWMDFRLTDGATDVPLGREVAVACAGHEFEVEVMSAMDIARVELVWNQLEPDDADCDGPDYSGGVGTGTNPWEVSSVAPAAGTEIASHSATLGSMGLTAGETYVVYARAFFDDEEGDEAEAAWSSPIWLTPTSCP